MPDQPTPAHDFTDPLGHLSALEAAWVAADGTIARCPHCHETTAMLPMTGTSWGVEHFHEDGCPDHDDNLPTPVRPGSIGEASEEW